MPEYQLSPSLFDQKKKRVSKQELRVYMGDEEQNNCILHVILSQQSSRTKNYTGSGFTLHAPPPRGIHL